MSTTKGLFEKEQGEVLPIRKSVKQPREAKRNWKFYFDIAILLIALGGMTLISKLVSEKFKEMDVRLMEARASQETELQNLRADINQTYSENSVFLKIMLLKPGIDKGLARDIAHSVVLRAREHRRDPDLVLAIIDVESDFNPNAVSHMGAIGLMQIMPLWIPKLGITQDLRHVDTSISNGLKILAFYEMRYQTLEMALTAYNKGEVNVDRDLKRGNNPMNGYAESIMRTYSRIKSWMRP